MSDESTLSTKYDPRPVESRLYAWWEEKGFFHAKAEGGGAPFCVVIPPPNVTGALHMGHALNNALQDILVRWRRMQGRNALWMPGTDHAGIATQNVVERELAKKGKKRHDLGREAFVKEVWSWKEQYGSRIINQLKRLGASCDWERTRFTMDEGLSRAVREAFVTLHERGLIYRGKRLINWCPRCATALADDEVEHEERDGHLWYLKYPFKDEPRLHVIVATTRPETMLGDTAVAVNPKDERYKEFIGQKLLLPVAGREIPIIADDHVDPEFGTGAVKVTPAHDPNDFEMGRRHNLEQVIVMNEDATMNAQAGEYEGMDRYECREALVEELREKKLIEEVRAHRHSVGHCYRCRTVIEPYLSDQWFVSMRPLADAALTLSAKDGVKFHPDRWKRVYESWLENVRDWCISRQIWWGHRIPAWHCAGCGRITVSRTDPDRCAHCGGAEIRQDEDVLDTWFSSSLWPFSTLGWPEKTAMLGRFYPTSVLVTARDIIYFWVARMVMMGLQMPGRQPFDDVLIHGTILDAEGRRMSKSLGNGIDPIEVIDQYGADAMRFCLVMLTVEGQDVKLSVDKFEMGRNFANKMWNASRFALLNLASGKGCEGELALEDRWILARLQCVTATVTKALEAFQLNEAVRTLYDFMWKEFCDWYLEAIKPRLADGTPSVARKVLAHVLDATLRLAHPFMPFVTEEIWQLLRARVAEGDLEWRGVEFPESIMISRWPAVEAARRDAAAEETFGRIQDIIRAVRNIRSKLGVAERKALAISVAVPDEGAAGQLRAHERLLKELGFIEQAEIGIGLARPAASATDVVGQMQVFVPLKGVLDIDVERERLQKRIGEVEKYVDGLLKKLANANFLNRAPADVVAREKARCAELEEEIAKLRQSLAELERG
jgi:valyl-tRNA synthetase